MDVRGVSRLDRAGGKASLQTSVIAANAESAAEVEGHVSKVAGSSRGTAHDHAIDERRTTDSRAESEQNHVAKPSSGSPQHLGDKGRACVIVSTDLQAIPSGQLAQRASFQKIQVAGQAINPRGGRIDHSFYSQSRYPALVSARACARSG